MSGVLAGCNSGNSDGGVVAGDPVVVSDRYEFAPGSTLSVGPLAGVLANDNPGSGASQLTVLSSTASSFCTGSGPIIAQDGSITCQHSGTERQVTLEYTVVSDASRAAIGTVTLVANRPPVALADEARVPYTVGSDGQSNSPCSGIDVLANDTDPDGDSVRIVRAEVIASSAGTPGIVEVRTDNLSLCYKPISNAPAEVRYFIRDDLSAAGQSVEGRLTLTIGDAAGDGQIVGRSDTIQIRKGEANRIEAGRLLLNDSAFGQPMLPTYGLLDGNDNPPPGAVAGYRVEYMPKSGPESHRTEGPGNAPFVLNRDGSFLYVHNNDASNTKRSDDDVFRYRIVFVEVKANGVKQYRYSSPVKITLVPSLAGDQSPIARADSLVLNPLESSAACGANRVCIDIPVLYNDEDPEDRFVTYKGIVEQPRFGTVDDSALRTSADAVTLRYTLRDTVSADEQDERFTYSIADRLGNTSTATVTIDFVNIANRVPEVVRVETVSVTNSLPKDFQPMRSGSIDDPDGDLLTLTRLGSCTPVAFDRACLPPGFSGTLEITDIKRGVLTYTLPNSVSLPPDFSESISYEVSDGRGGSVASRMEFRLNRTANEAPIACADPGAGNDSKCTGFHRDDAALSLFEATACGRPVALNILLNDLDPNNDFGPPDRSDQPVLVFDGERRLSSDLIVPHPDAVRTFAVTDNVPVTAVNRLFRGGSPRLRIVNPSLGVEHLSDSGVGRIEVDPSGVFLTYRHAGPQNQADFCFPQNAPEFDTFTYVARDANAVGDASGERSSLPVTVRIRLRGQVPSLTPDVLQNRVDGDADGVPDCLDGYAASGGLLRRSDGFLYCQPLPDDPSTPRDERPLRTGEVLALDQCPGTVLPTLASVVFANGCLRNQASTVP